MAKIETIHQTMRVFLEYQVLAVARSRGRRNVPWTVGRPSKTIVRRQQCFDMSTPARRFVPRTATVDDLDLASVAIGARLRLSLW